MYMDNIYEFERIYIYGAGRYGRLVASLLIETGHKPICFVVSYKTEERVDDLKVLSLYDVPDYDKEKALLYICVRDRAISEEMKFNAKKSGFKNIKNISDRMIKILEHKAELRNQMMNDIITDFDLNGKRLLVVAPHPDDEVIGCGGLLSEFGKETDVLCINSSGVKYEWNKESAEEIAENRINEFYNVMELLNVRNSYIAKIWGTPPMFAGIKSNIGNYINAFDYSSYDYIFTPYIKDAHREHMYVTNYVLPEILSKVNFKSSLIIAFYEVWSVIENPNFYYDISELIENKRNVINAYYSRKRAEYADRILGLNRYRGLIAGCNYAEAYRIVPVHEFMKIDFTRRWDEP